eukprot:GAFH01000802.1.p1 GENE.GAFH01000802.1~~GAFH01000802.1.p1  ORF type:complete len:926 (-),score=379.32 GAFH01000802.1:65-2842(-)
MTRLWLFLSLLAVGLCSTAQYRLKDIVTGSGSLQGTLELINGTCGPYAGQMPDVATLRLRVECLPTGPHIRIDDPARRRYEVANISVLNEAPLSTCTLYDLTYTEEPFTLTLTRPGTSHLLWKSLPGLVFEDQYIEWTTILGSPETAIYGLGERVGPLRLDMNHTYTIFTRDNGGTPPDVNLNGAHPVWMDLQADGQAHGGMMLNSNGMDVVLTPGDASHVPVVPATMQWRLTGGIVDLYLYPGPSPHDVVRQHTRIVGLPVLMPLWGLGWHQCRWGYKSLDEVKAVVEGYRSANIPLEVQWTDIDYMDAHKDFTFDPAQFPQAAFAAFVEELHTRGQKWVPIIDPAIKAEASHEPFMDGVRGNLFVQDQATGLPLVGAVWPGNTTFPDFSNPATHAYWTKWMRAFHEMAAWDGIWIDMNEPDSFTDVPVGTFLELSGGARPDQPLAEPELPMPRDPPPYLPGGRPLAEHSISPRAVQLAGWHYDLHSLYGHHEAVATNAALASVLPGKRPFIISRSTFPGSGRYTMHWLGDNYSTFVSMKYSIQGIINFQQYGMPFVGADICGFIGDTTPELCTRWIEMGALYPFSRDHNEIGKISQEPYVFGEPYTAIMRRHINLRYSLISFYYTLLVDSHRTGTPLFNALAWVFPPDPLTHDIDTQFMVGTAILASPALEQGATTVSAYLPADTRWYDFYTGVEAPATGRVTLAAPLETLPLHLAGGHVVPLQEPAMTVAATVAQPVRLLVALDSARHAQGTLYMDDGVSADSVQQAAYTEVLLTAENETLAATIVHHGFPAACERMLRNVTVLGLHPPADMPRDATIVEVSPASATYQYDSANGILTIGLGAGLSLCQEAHISWHFTHTAPAQGFPWWIIVIAVVVCVVGVLLLWLVYRAKTHKRRQPGGYSSVPQVEPTPGSDRPRPSAV